MSDSCCGGCGGQGHEPKKEQPVVQEHNPETEQKQGQKEDE
ncbi:MAG: hypothetical protein AB7U63_16860 [Porticoccaceae bacterium]